MAHLYNQPTKGDNNFVDHLDNWMSELPSAIRGLPVINLAIPGKIGNICLLFTKLYDLL